MPGFIHKLKTLIISSAKGRAGFTAIQMAIGMTASIIAAGSVATMVISSGTGLSNQTEEAVDQTISSLEGTFMLRSDLYGKASITGAHGTLGQITFTVGLVLSSGEIDFTPPAANPDNNGLAAPDSQNRIVISYTDANQRVENLFWTVNLLSCGDGDYILEGGELFQITVGSAAEGQDGGNLIDALNPDLSTNSRFVLELKHAQTPGLTIETGTPGSFTNVVTLQ